MLIAESIIIPVKNNGRVSFITVYITPYMLLKLGIKNKRPWLLFLQVDNLLTIKIWIPKNQIYYYWDKDNQLCLKIANKKNPLLILVTNYF